MNNQNLDDASGETRCCIITVWEDNWVEVKMYGQNSIIFDFPYVDRFTLVSM